jgi:hypothetical protein
VVSLLGAGSQIRSQPPLYHEMSPQETPTYASSSNTDHENLWSSSSELDHVKKKALVNNKYNKQSDLRQWFDGLLALIQLAVARCLILSFHHLVVHLVVLFLVLFCRVVLVLAGAVRVP